MRFFYQHFPLIICLISMIPETTMQSSLGGIINIPYSKEDCKEFIESTQHQSSDEYELQFQFKSPNHPSNYSSNLDCIKIIQAPDDHVIVLSIHGEFELEPHNLCTHDFLEIRDGKYGFSPSFGIFCSSKTKIFERISSTQKYMWIRFRSDSSIERSGFTAYYTFKRQKKKYYPGKVRDSQTYELDEKNILISDTLLKLFANNLPEYQRNLPLESVLEFKCPQDSMVAMHIHNFTVPKQYQWSCKPEEIEKFRGKSNCRAANTLSLKRLRRSDVLPKDESDLTQTYLEIYEENTISERSIPCPRIRRLCSHENITIPIISPSNVMVLRIMVASPLHAPTKRPESVVEMFPTVALNLVCLKNQVNGDCPPDFKVCDKNCIRTNYFCDEDFSCKKSEEDNKYCKDEGKPNDHKFSPPEENSDKKELSAATVHMSILGIIAFLLVTITASCFIIAFRSKAKQNHANENIIIPIELNEAPDTCIDPESENLLSSVKQKPLISKDPSNYQIFQGYSKYGVSKSSIRSRDLQDSVDGSQQIFTKSHNFSNSNNFLEQSDYISVKRSPQALPLSRAKKSKIFAKMKHFRNHSQDFCNDTCQQVYRSDVPCSFHEKIGEIDTSTQQEESTCDEHDSSAGSHLTDWDKKKRRNFHNISVPNLLLRYRQGHSHDSSFGGQDEDTSYNERRSVSHQKNYQPSIKITPVNHQSLVTDSEEQSEAIFSDNSTSTPSDVFDVTNDIMRNYLSNFNAPEIFDPLSETQSSEEPFMMNGYHHHKTPSISVTDVKPGREKITTRNYKENSLFHKRTVYSLIDELQSSSTPTKSSMKNCRNMIDNHLPSCDYSLMNTNEASFNSNLLPPPSLVKTISSKNERNKSAHVKEYIA